MLPSRARGFTLIELLIVIAIVGILATLAYPSYQDHLRKGYRAEGRAALVHLMQQQERHFSANNTYQALSSGETGTAFKTWSGDNGPSAARYKLEATACGSGLTECVKLTATPSFTDTNVGSLSIDSLGNRTCTGPKKEQCWQ